jgi:capsular exopolysaccharide synthesis family protein
MSRIHEAITKAAKDREAKTSFEPATVEEILSAGYLAGRGTRTPPSAGPDNDSRVQPIVCTHEMWDPDKRRVLFCSDEADAVVREQIRSIRTKLSRLHEVQKTNVIAVCSAISGEGKTFVAVNLAYALAAQRDGKVLLIDCDLRRGSAADYLAARSTPGLAEYVVDQQPLRDVLQTGSNSRLYLIASGRRVAEPGELVGDSRFSGLIQQCREMFDWIIIDTPPVVQFSDATVIANLCDGVLLVVRGGSTPVSIAKRAVQAFNEGAILGAVLNCTDIVASLSKYYNYY